MGRPKKKPGYDSEKIMEQFTNCIAEAYMSGAGGGSVNSLRQISEQFSITLMKTRKILITAGVYHTELSEQVISLRENGKNISEIMQETGLSRSSVHSYLPYTKMIYNADELSLYAERCRLYRKKRSITRSRVNIALKETLEMNGKVSGPKKLNVFGASYLYPIFRQIGLISVE